MTYVRLLWRVELAALAALVLCSALLAVLAFAESSLSPHRGSALIDPPSMLRLVAIYSVAFGAIPALCFGAPAYTWLRHTGRASWPLVIIVGLLPGLVVLPFELDLGMWFVVAGVAVALVTHALSIRFVREQL